MKTATFKIWRGNPQGGKFEDYTAEVSDGMVVLDAVHQIQANQANDLACRWNCKAGKCGSCSAEVNGLPRLMCMTRLSEIPLDQPITIEPMKAGLGALCSTPSKADTPFTAPSRLPRRVPQASPWAKSS